MWLPLSSDTIAIQYIASAPNDNNPQLLADFLVLASRSLFADQFSAVTSIGLLHLTTKESWNDHGFHYFDISIESQVDEIIASFQPPNERDTVKRRGTLDFALGLIELVAIRWRLTQSG